MALAPFDGLVLEAADAVELGFAHPVEQELEVFLGLARKADDERRAHGEIGADLAPLGDAVRGLLLMRGAAHGLQHCGRRMLERDVEIGEDLSLGHQRNDVVHVRVGIDVVHAHPDAE